MRFPVSSASARARCTDSYKYNSLDHFFESKKYSLKKNLLFTDDELAIMASGLGLAPPAPPIVPVIGPGEPTSDIGLSEFGLKPRP